MVLGGLISVYRNISRLQEVADVLHLLEGHSRFVHSLHTPGGYAVHKFAQQNAVPQGFSERAGTWLLCDRLDPPLRGSYGSSLAI